MKTNHKIKIYAVSTAVIVFAFSLMSLTFKINKGEGVPEAYKNMVNPVASNATTIAAGKVLYTKSCKMCHGVDGKGGKMAGESDFTSAAFKALKNGEIYYYTTEGVGKMPAYKNKIKEANDRWSIVNYLRTL